MNLTELLSNITDEKTIQKWKAQAAKEIKAFARNTNPFRQLKVSNYYLFIDTKSRTFAIELQGVKPNAAHAKGFGAPVNKYKKTANPVYFINENGEWRATHKERKTSPTLGTKALETNYFGVSGKPKAFFGLKRKKGKEAFGLIGDTAVPIYSDEGFVEYLTQDSEAELERILFDAGYTAMGV